MTTIDNNFAAYQDEISAISIKSVHEAIASK